MKTAKQMRNAIRLWKARKRKYDFCRKHLKKILSLSMEGWPRMTNSPNYPEWLELVYLVKKKGLFAWSSSTCDVIMNLRSKAEQIKKVIDTGGGCNVAASKIRCNNIT